MLSYWKPNTGFLECGRKISEDKHGTVMSLYRSTHKGEQGISTLLLLSKPFVLKENQYQSQGGQWSILFFYYFFNMWILRCLISETKHKNLGCYTRCFRILPKNMQQCFQLFENCHLWKAQEILFLETTEWEVASLKKRNNKSIYFQIKPFLDMACKSSVLVH